MMKKLKLRLSQMWAIVMMLMGWLCSKFYRERNLWLFSERGTDARDNGMWMFRYVKENHPKINAKYIITKDSEDRIRLASWENDLVEYGSLQHYILLLNASYCISTHIGGCYPYNFRISKKMYNFLSQYTQSKKIFLQHGIIKDDIKALHYNKTQIDMFVCGAKPEYDYVAQKYGYPEGIVKYTGLARFDNLRKITTDKKQILLMPTWRSWLQYEDFISSEFYHKYVDLLKCKSLHKLIEDNNLTLVFYPHYEVQKYVSEFKKIHFPSNLIIAEKKEFDVQQLLIESSLLITDYSSVYFDFVYMEKPVLYYQFDEVRYRKEQYQDGYYDYHNGLGEWTDNEEQLILKIKEYIHHDFEISSKFRSKTDEFFPIRDNKNCERIYNEIARL